MKELDPARQIRDALGEHADSFDEPLSIRLLARVRSEGILDDGEWARLLEFAAAYARRPRVEAVEREVPNADADPRNADWIKIVRARKFSGMMLPSWAALWLWWLGRDPDGETGFWESVGLVAASLGVETLREV